MNACKKILISLLFLSSFLGCLETKIPKEYITFQLPHEIDKDNAKKLTDKMIAAPAEGKEGIILLINSIGGSLKPIWDIVLTIKLLPVPVVCFAHGNAASGAAIILAMCDYRIATASTPIFFHPVFNGRTGKEVEPFIDLDIPINRYVTDIYITIANRIGMDPQKLKKIIGLRAYITANTAKEWGFIDEVFSN